MAQAGVTDVLAIPMLLGPLPLSGERLVNEVSARALRLAHRAAVDEQPRRRRSSTLPGVTMRQGLAITHDGRYWIALARS
jgi:hypothetical protein